MASGINNTPGRPSFGYDFGKYGGLGDVTSLLQSDRIKNPNTLFRLFGPGLAQELGFYNESTFGRLGALRNAYDALDPANRGFLVDSYLTNAMGQAQGQGRRTGNMLMRQFGSQPGLQAGAELSATNRALSDAGRFRSQIYSPFNLADMYMGQANALSPMNALQGFQMASPFFAGQKQKGTFMDTVTGLAGSAFAGGWKPF